MPDVQIFDEKEGVAVKISPRGELIVAPISNSDIFNVTVDVADEPFEIVRGLAGKKFIVTGMLIATSKTFGSATTAETIELYQAHPSDLAISTNSLLDLDMLKNDRMIATGLNLTSGEASSLVAKATDTTASITFGGYYIEA